ncbi:hypothetical protein E2F47_01965 [Mycobacterium eburneum]|nr:hypothetical protein [Mycobacterium eburneum]TDH57558.1 hypothetical protein E2F47_01965 [Mycobacterium eburneum]
MPWSTSAAVAAAPAAPWSTSTAVATPASGAPWQLVRTLLGQAEGSGSASAALVAAIQAEAHATGAGTADLALAMTLIGAAHATAVPGSLVTVPLGAATVDGYGSGMSSAPVPRLLAAASGFGGGSDSVTEQVAGHGAATGIATATAAFPVTAPVPTTITATGAYTYSIPWWCTKIDVVLVGAGGGGASPGTFYTLSGFGGAAGTWATATLTRGVDIPWSLTNITGAIGAGGARGSGGFLGTAGSAGGATTASATGWAGLSGAGGAGGQQSATGTSDPSGASPGNETYNDRPYTGGAKQSSAGAAGNAPGGAGAGGSPFGGSGGIGGAGCAWFYAYQ